MGGSASQLERDIRSFEKEYGSDFPVNEHYFGLVNFGNTCYCNSVLQALYFCRPFREKVLEYKAKNKKNREETLLTCLADLFQNIATQKKKTGTVAPKKFITRLRKENVVFDNFHQQDAHEFLNYLLNTIGDLLNNEKNEKNHCNSNLNNSSNVSGHTVTSNNNSTTIGTNATSNGTNGTANCTTNNSSAASVTSTNTSASTNNHFTFTFNTMSNASPNTWVHDIFKGTLTNETLCLNCECLSSKDEDFLDLSVDIRQNTSITQCLNDFSKIETLSSEHKYYCENCCSKQEAQKRMRIKKLPMILALHLKRFKYMESQSRHTKLSHRVVFPLELRLFHRTNDIEDKLYDLVAVVIHCGPGPNRGHYISIVKSFGFWLLFDDDLVEKIEPSGIEEFFGLTSDNQKTSETGYILFYQSREDLSPNISTSASANNSSNASFASTTSSTTSNNSFSSTSASSNP